MSKDDTPKLVRFHIEFDNNLREIYLYNGLLGKEEGIKTLTFEIILDNGLRFYGTRLVKNPDDEDSHWGIENIKDKKYDSE